MLRAVGALFFVLFPATTPSVAGTICGTVRDAQSLQPLPRAAVFLFDDQNQYTGRYAGTDQVGFYCLVNVPSGMYTIQVRVNDYVAAIVTDVIVDDVTRVDIAATPRFFLGEPTPNPASRDVTFRLHAPDGADVTLEVFDVCGRMVKGWRGHGSGRSEVSWDMRDASGGTVASGVYLVRLRADGAQTVRRLVCVR